jgi:hypothetical protein
MKHLFRLIGLGLLLLIGLVACPQPPAQTAPKINTFTATPSSLSAATTVKLEWTVSNASSLSISPNVGVVTGSSTTVNVAASTTFELTAQNSAGTDKKTVLITLQSPLFDPSNAWKAPIPSNAEQISPEVFQQKVESGELLPMNDTTGVNQEKAAEQQYQNDLSSLRGIQNPSPSVQELLNAPSLSRPDPETTLPSGEKVLLLGQRSAARALAGSVQQSQNSSNALGVYSSLYDFAPNEIQAQVPSPSSLQGLALSAVQTALNALNTLLSSEAALDGTRPETAPTTGAPLRTQAIVAGNGYDNDLFRRDCRTPTGLLARFRFPLKYFISPVKNQAVRGLCWAFTALGAIESRERVQNNTVVDLSEQFLAFKVKAQWSPSDFEDGFSTELALDQANAKAQVLPDEAFWTYNPAFGRQAVENDLVASYAKSCDWQFAGLKYNGTCSNSAHQGNAVCTALKIGVLNLPFCATQTENYLGTGILPSSSRTIWSSGQPFLLSAYRTLLAQGYTLMASFPVYQGFQTIDAKGFLTNRNRDGLAGSHAVQIVGFISNDLLTAPTDPQNAPGGGYFIVKNSWGCTFGDGGYAYIDAQYVQDIFYNLTTLNFDSRRSAAWTTEQTALVSPQITPAAAPRKVNLRVSSNLGTLFAVSHPQAEVKNVNLTVKLGNTTLYTGLIATPTLLPLELPYTFSSTGNQTLQVTARYGTQSTTQNIDFEVVNTAPRGDLKVAVAPIYVYSSNTGAATFNLTITDPNESNPSSLCAGVQWEVQAPDVIEGDPNTGCSKQIRFGINGYRNVFVYLTDSDGLQVKTGGAFLVENPPANPNPVFTGAGIVPVERLRSGNCSAGMVLSNGATLNLESLSYGTNCAGNANTAHYTASARADNPSAEQLEYDWIFRINGSIANRGYAFNSAVSSLGTYLISFTAFGLGGTFPCALEVQIIPTSDASRAKYITAWTGFCKVAAAVPR